MRAVALTVFVVLLLVIVAHLLLVVRDSLLARATGSRQAVMDSLADELMSPRPVLIGTAAFVVAYVLGVNLGDQPSLTPAALLLLGFIVGWAGWVCARMMLRRKVIGDDAVAWWAAVPVAVITALLFAWSGVA